MQVEVSRRAEADLKTIASFIGVHHSLAAAEWFDRLVTELQTLSTLPERGTALPGHSGNRQILFGSRPHVYRIIYRAYPKIQRVIVVQIRHGARR